jgi:hypothetical protein
MAAVMRESGRQAGVGIMWQELIDSGKIVRASEAAEILGVPVRRIYQYADLGWLHRVTPPKYKYGFYPRAEVERIRAQMASEVEAALEIIRAAERGEGSNPAP